MVLRKYGQRSPSAPPASSTACFSLPRRSFRSTRSTNIILRIGNCIKTDQAAYIVYRFFVFPQCTAAVGIDKIEFRINDVSLHKFINLFFYVCIGTLCDKDINQTTP